jgi:hypothetical protein
MLASFEQTNDHFFDAAAHARSDDIVGVRPPAPPGDDGVGSACCTPHAAASPPARPRRVVKSRVCCGASPRRLAALARARDRSGLLQRVLQRVCNMRCSVAT